MSSGILIFIVGILVVVMIHESGHFLMAKLFDLKATKFFLGFGPTLWSTQRGETEYGVKALPLGGFVKIVGMNPYEEVAPEDESRSYPNKPKWQRALVLVAGSATHWVVAFVILFIMFAFIGEPSGPPTTEIATVSADSPAASAGFEPEDRIVGVAGADADTWNEISEFIKAHPGDEVTFVVERDGDTVEVDATIGRAIFDEDGNVNAYSVDGDELRDARAGETEQGFLGIAPQRQVNRQGVVEALGSAGAATWQGTVGSVRGIGEVFSQIAPGGKLWDALGGQGEREITEGPLGIVGAGRLAGESAQRGMYFELLGLIVGFTIFVGIMNLLPLPPLDGGHLAVLAWEAITGKQVDVRKLIPVAAAVISFFVVLFLAVLYLDLARPIKVPL
ncbi:MAG TPA: site-2 protease family protein [Actinomycetota bacterium]|nr:site-2 protease family protein [Actinomycetota bacterium]